MTAGAPQSLTAAEAPASTEQGAFRAAFDTCYGDILGFCTLRVGPDDGQDLAAEVFARAWQSWPHAPADPRPWLYGIARHLVVDRYREKARHPHLGLTAAPDGVGPDAHGLTETRLDLRQAWAQLGDDDREVLALVAWDDLSPADAAQVLGISRAAATMRLSRARRRLRRRLDDADGPAAARTPAAPSRHAPPAREPAASRPARPHLPQTSVAPLCGAESSQS